VGTGSRPPLGTQRAVELDAVVGGVVRRAAIVLAASAAAGSYDGVEPSGAGGNGRSSVGRKSSRGSWQGWAPSLSITLTPPEAAVVRSPNVDVPVFCRSHLVEQTHRRGRELFTWTTAETGPRVASRLGAF